LVPSRPWLQQPLDLNKPRDAIIYLIPFARRSLARIMALRGVLDFKRNENCS
jgi:hypothetical protein